MAFELPEDVRKETGVNLSLQAKKKILGLNAAKLYNIDVEAMKSRHSATHSVAAE
jgi:predicted TIM-barrel fold metal-dependent hydrolase